MNQNNQKLFRITALTILLFVLCLLFFKSGRDIPSDSDRWQAVFLTDGQVYFGKLENENRSFALLKDVYYLKFAEGLQQERGEQTASSISSRNLNLIRLGSEAHGPEGEMYIAKDKILFFENLKDSSTVVQAIINNQR